MIETLHDLESGVYDEKKQHDGCTSGYTAYDVGMSPTISLY
jgi:hypothetical protein